MKFNNKARRKIQLQRDQSNLLFITEVTSVTNRDKLIFIPGLGCTTRYWQTRINPLEENYRIFLLDLLGFGQSPKPWFRYSMERHIDAMHQTISRHKPFTLVGYSLGAILSLVYAVRYPEQVEKLILIGLPYFRNGKIAMEYFKSGPKPDRWLLTNFLFAALTCIVTRRLFGLLLPYILRDLPKEVAQDLTKHHWLSFTSTFWEVIYRFNLDESIKRLDNGISVSCVHGDHDSTAPIQSVKRLVRERKNWDLTIIQGGDHHLLLHHRDDCVKAILSALQKN